MSRQNFLSDEPWDEIHEDAQIRTRIFDRRPGGRFGASQGIDGLHTFTNPTSEPARILAVSAGRLPDVVAYPEQGIAWVATRDPDFPTPETGDKGIIARFELPAEE